MDSITETILSPIASIEPPPVPPMAHFQRRVNQWLRALRESARAAGILPLNVGDVGIDVLDALRSNLIMRGAAALRALHPAHGGAAPAARTDPFGDDLSWWRACRLRAYQAKRWVSRRFYTPPFARTAEQLPLILGFPRMPGHLNDMLPVAKELQLNGVAQVVFAAYDRNLAGQISAAGAAVINPFSYARTPTRILRAQARAFIGKLEDLIEGPGSVVDDFSANEIAALSSAALKMLRTELEEALFIAYAFVGLVRSIRPDLTLVGNPYTTEGRILSVLSKQQGTPSAAIEHGSIFPNSPHWEECPSDLICAWGEVSRRALISCGVPDERIAVTGGPRYDAVFQQARESTDRRDPARATVLVATSGPGDQVSHVQHRAFIASLFDAAAATPSVRWVVKLHRKDAVANYDIPQAEKCRNVSVMRAEYARDGLEIFDYLRSARALVTISSSAAFDAMAVGVPVISFDVWPEEYKRTEVEFLQRGCTRSVRTAQELAEEVASAWRFEANPVVEAAAARYIDEHFANRGCAAPAAARQILRLLGGRTTARAE